MRFRLALVVFGVLSLGFGLSSWADARTNLAVAQRLLAEGRAADAVTQVHLVAYAKKNGDQRLQVDAVRVALSGAPGASSADDGGLFDGPGPQTGPWTAGWTLLTGADEVADLPYDAALENRWVASRPVDGYPSPTSVRFVLAGDGTGVAMAESDLRRWDGPTETTIGVVFVVVGLGLLVAAALVIRGDLRRRRGRRALERARVLREQSLRGPQDAVSPTPQDAPLPLRERRRGWPYEGRHRTPLEPDPQRR